MFVLPRPDSVLGLPMGYHIAVRAAVDGQVVSRSYAPISNNSNLSRIELIMKVCDQGLITQLLQNMIKRSSLVILPGVGHWY